MDIVCTYINLILRGLRYLKACKSILKWKVLTYDFRQDHGNKSSSAAAHAAASIYSVAPVDAESLLLVFEYYSKHLELQRYLVSVHLRLRLECVEHLDLAVTIGCVCVLAFDFHLLEVAASVLYWQLTSHHLELSEHSLAC
jgi:hypothetical protein